jgi:ribosomal protein S18 acetylase RimI-like enzyme
MESRFPRVLFCFQRFVVAAKMGGMKIREARKSDAAVVAEFNIRLARESEGLELDAETVRQGVEAVLKDPAKGIYFVAELAAEETGELRVAGQLMITYEWSDWRNGNIWWIQSVYVKEEFRGRGVFRALFDHVEGLAQESAEVCALRLYMDKHNQKARAAYKKLGMTEGGYVVFEKGLEGGRMGD